MWFCRLVVAVASWVDSRCFHTPLLPVNFIQDRRRALRNALVYLNSYCSLRIHNAGRVTEFLTMDQVWYDSECKLSFALYVCSLKYMQVAMVTILKNTTNILTALGDTFFFGKRHNRATWGSLGLVVRHVSACLLATCRCNRVLKSSTPKVLRRSPSITARSQVAQRVLTQVDSGGRGPQEMITTRDCPVRLMTLFHCFQLARLTDQSARNSATRVLSDPVTSLADLVWCRGRCHGPFV